MLQFLQCKHVGLHFYAEQYDSESHQTLPGQVENNITSFMIVQGYQAKFKNYTVHNNLMSVSIYILVIKCMHVAYSILSKYFLNCKYQDCNVNVINT